MELFKRRCNVSPLILAFVFITFFQHVLSRHRIRHYKDRFKRQQGAHLYLPGSYVQEGEGREEGPWSEWSEPSPCSRTCGGGVTTQYRVCLDGYICRGPEKRYFSCNTQDCPDIADFRSQQCSHFDNIPFEGVYYQWIPYTKAPNPCELNCMPRGERFYFRHAPTVVDGTRCDDEKLDVCVNGKCQPVGCDMMLGSTAKEDQCRVCGGDGSTCNTIENTLPMKDMQVGYNDILLIPAGATNIRVEEMGPSNNYLAVRNTSGHYYLNGNWRIDFPRSVEFAGCKFHYERSPQGFSAPDKLTCLGPTDEPLFIVLLFQDSDIPVSYTYSLPTNVVPGSESETYAWTFDEFTPCSTTCGGGFQYRNVTCAGRKTLEPVDRSLCDTNTEPDSQKRCNEIACEAQWIPHPWGDCSAPCGDGGVQTREFTCQQIVSNGYPTLANESECLKLQPKPPTQQKCNVGRICAKWHAGPWKPCDHLCGDGKQTRKATCYIKNEEGKIEVLEHAECEAIEPKPEETKKCNVRPCEGVDWITSEWSGCERICGLTNETRKVHCATASGEVYSDDLCEAEQKPKTVRKCEATNVTCEYLWYASQWSECSVICGEGVQTRTLFCGVVTLEGVKKVEKDKCDKSKHFETMKSCVGEKEECEGEWFSGPWGKCSKPCGGGERTKKVVCLKDNVVVDPSICGSDKIVFSQEDCNAHPCSEDSIMPTDVSHPVDESEPTTEKEKVSREATTEIFTSESETTETSEVTAESATEAGVLEDEDEYEIVPATECDDGEWVDVDEEPSDFKQDARPKRSNVVVEGSTTETPFSLDDLMLSDGTTVLESESDFNLDTGSGASELTSQSTVTDSTDFTKSSDEEGSGTESTIIETLDTEVTYATPKSESTDSEISGATTETPGSTVSGPSEPTEVTSSESEITPETLGTDQTTESPASDITTETEVTSETTAESSDLTESTEETVTGSTSTEATESTETTESEATGATETTESPGATEGVQTSEIPLTESGLPSGSTGPSTIPGVLQTTPELFIGESEVGQKKKTTEPPILDGSVVLLIPELMIQFAGTPEPTIEFTGSTIAPTTEFTASTELPVNTVEFTGTTEQPISTTEQPANVTEITGTTEQPASVTEITVTTEQPVGTTEKPVGTAEKPVITTEQPVGTTEQPVGTTEQPVGTTEKRVDTTEKPVITTEQPVGTTEFTGPTERFSTTIKPVGSTEVPTGGTTQPNSFATITGELIGSTTEPQASTTESETVSATTEPPYVTTEMTGGATEIPVTSEETYRTTESSETTTEYTATTETEFDIFASTTESKLTEETVSTPEYSTTSIMEIFRKKPRMCKRRKIKACKRTQYGCCWDYITPAEGPFDKGCPTPKTCKESKFGCCQDGVSATLGPKFAGCPASHCNETLFGCCPDNKTAAEGNDYEGCPEPPPKCLASKYGCCKDNVTEAGGPKQEGCEKKAPEVAIKVVEEETTIEPETTTEPLVTEDCNNTTYRCCPDGITASQGPGFQGCDLPCSNTTFGCCQDASTAAHGPSGEGCCLSTAFGCCPDNIIPARGLNMEGCGCQSSPYGCCPDNTTSARGYDNEGCGCQYTKFRCCPDNFTPANGENFEGCLCHTFQFGCCPDGITTARGTHQQGCGCRNTEFGCCSDGTTPASGPNLEGCGCEASKFGCCLDGVTEAKGENFEECETAPPNLQVSCSLPKQRGTCRNYTVKWFFDMDYSGCSRFWYGGCEGNDNRYKTKEECDHVCVEPEGQDRCNLPKVKGPCEGYYPQWYYDKDLKHCAQFIYGGCLGNNNKFETREECMQLCVKDSSIDACEQLKEEGPCRGEYQRYYYDKDSGQCNAFVYGGCKGNNNNFLSMEACRQKCTAPGRKKDHCSLPRAQGNCTERLPRWYHDTVEKRCVPFYYSGCNGNQNNFDSKGACENDCPMDVVKDTCQLPAETGECANYVDRWYYDTRERVCRQFYYGGCGGNGNNFETQQRCRERCEQRKLVEPPPQPGTQQPPQPSQPAQPSQPPETVAPFTTNMCFLPSDPGPCRSGTVKYYYDVSDGVCKSFTYGGCKGNRNNFNSIEECLQYCGTAQDLCTLPPVVGPCNGEYLQYYYDSANDTCFPFHFGGCGGNYNRFQDQASCERRCKKAPPTNISVTQAPPISPSIAICYQPPDSGNCTDNSVAFFFDKDTGKCSPFTYTGCGGNDNRFNSEEQCDRQCGGFRGQDVCNMERDPGPCRGYFVKYYYDKSTGRCEQFAFGGCQGNGNRFSSNEECERICVTHEEKKPNITSTAICQLPVDKGSCDGGYHKRWYFDDARGECIAFIYSGCGGNFNNFKSFQSCLDFCRELLPQTEAPVPVDVPTRTPEHPCQEVFDECATIRCAYGVEAYVDENECNRCQCRNPCKSVECLEDEQCAIDINRNKTSSEDADFIAICRKSIKPGTCPNLEQSQSNCEQECRTDADCTLHLKCCSTGCGTACVDPTPPAQLVTQQPEPAYTESPFASGYQPPRVDTLVYKPEVSALIGDQVILNCAVVGNPNPRITWSRDNIVIDGTQPRYRIKLDQSLQIITLHKTDAGIYLCTADNSIGEPLANQIRLNVVVPVRANITTNDQRYPLGSDIQIPCEVQGYPIPQVLWYKDNMKIVPSEKIQISDANTLTILRVTKNDAGYYQCEATNAYSKASSTLEILIEGMYIHPSCTDNQFFANCELIVKAQFCTHKYYAKFCCRSCTEAGLLPVDGSHLHQSSKQNALDNNLV